MTKYSNDLKIGDFYDPLDFTVTPEFNQQYLFAQDDFGIRYTSGLDGTPEVHPALLLSMSAQTKSPGFRLAPGTGSVLGEQTCSFFCPARVGEPLRVTWEVVDIYNKRGRDYQVVECILTKKNGEVVLSRRSHLTYRSE